MTTISDLSEELVEEILCRVPATSLKALRSTCKKWNALSKNQIFGKTEKQFLGFMMMDYRVCSVKFNLPNEDYGADPSIKQVALLDQVKISKLFHCDGLLLCVVKDNTGLVVWNPYLGQTKWIQPRTSFLSSDRYALGYDKNRNHKILRISCFGYEIYDLSSDLWKFYCVTPDWEIPSHQRGVSLKGDSYFLGHEKITVSGGEGVRRKIEDSLLCFDFTSERFGPPLPLPLSFHSYRSETMTLSCVGEEQLAVFSYHLNLSSVYEIWVTNKLEPNAVSWSKFLRSFRGSHVHIEAGSFFIDEGKKVAVVFGLDYKYDETRYQTAHIIGQGGYFKSVNIGEAPNLAKLDKPYMFGYTPRKYCYPVVCSSYVPSLVQLQINQPGKGKERDYY
ncbi:unnamed protein product [Arabidopsis lyrata]|uniref:F-box domain-containing protein n=1 Tax=Arabidopsis lyrata subsp. lyrata TaxID=81972 RepID=D7LMX4_ARALL|nr:F-box/kelch-repeat protein At3g13680 [Arabidopsis lyrata subsp. lyrata]EFH53722.1 hypothetical protein ARALYDRAFT_905807 [Arabidopsis lyrata subsp. lyrata]CAH8267612.1 unnamed protein product [Arabidopsis lyrata]|eukprot:XP_002877463.1 F-box/kelch-repeat protein At3g13680 [Arabidopsis lyrata subsp. lyrata]